MVFEKVRINIMLQDYFLNDLMQNYGKYQGKLLCIPEPFGSDVSDILLGASVRLVKTCGNPIYYFSLSKNEVDVQHYFKQLFQSEKREYTKIEIDDTPGNYIDNICGKCKKVKPKVIIIDQFQLVREKESDKFTRVGELDSIATKLTRLAQEMNVPILLGVAVSRTEFWKKDFAQVTPNDFKETGKIADIADGIVWTEKMTRGL